MSYLNLSTGIIYIVLIIVACLFGLWGLSKLSNKKTRIEMLNDTANIMKTGGKRHKVKRQIK